MRRGKVFRKGGGATGGLVLAGVILCVLLGVALTTQRVIDQRLRQTADRDAAAPAPADESLWERYRRLDRLARLLRGGEGLGPEDDAQALLKLPYEAVARRFMDDPRFADTILDFNLFFLGFKSDSLKSDGRYERQAFDFPNAVAAAQAMMRGGDYLTLFDLEGPFFMPPLRAAKLDDPPAPDDAGLDAAALRRKAVGEIRQILAELAAYSGKAQQVAVWDVCQRILGVTLKSDQWSARVLRAFDDWEGFGLVRGQAVVGPLDALGHAAWRECYGRQGVVPDVAVLADAVRTALTRYERIFAEVERFEPSRYQPRSVMEFRTFDLGVFPDTPTWPAFGYEQGLALANSSTNANRRRAAYILNRFFCDDLTPVGVEAPKQHVIGPIGAPSCQTCHYKLDPMGGFFRNYGAFFFDFSRAQYLTFDDLASVERSRYVAGWQASAQSGRQWNVGYIRSPGNDSINSYGDSLADLSAIIRNAPEAKQCLMKRLVQYAVAEDQAIDAGWLDQLTKRFAAEAAQNSAAAMRNAIVTVVTSTAFRQSDADPQRCYDSAPEGRRKDAPPCQVASILERNCARCHGSAGDSRLDLTTWSAADGFVHLDSQGHPIPARDSLARLIDSITTSDPAHRMPRGRPMTSQDRQALYKWAQERLTRLDGERGPR